MFNKLVRQSRYSQQLSKHPGHVSKGAVPATLLAGCPMMFQLKHSSNIASTQTINPDAPPLGRAMKKPIITGRHSKQHGYDIKELIPNPFVGRGLPFGRRLVFDNHLDEDLAKGKYWDWLIDRFVQYTDFDMVARAWGNHDLYRTPQLKQPFDGMQLFRLFFVCLLVAILAQQHDKTNTKRFSKWKIFRKHFLLIDLLSLLFFFLVLLDITVTNDINYEYRISNLGMHLEMMRHIPQFSFCFVFRFG